MIASHHAESRHDRLAEWQDIYVGRIRAIEDLYSDVHGDMLEWGRWGRERFPGAPRLMLSGVWIMVGEDDPNRDPSAVPTARMPAFDELRIFALDARINTYGFPPLWANVLRANYIPPKLKRTSAVHILPEHQRPTAISIDPEHYIEQLSNALDFLRTP